MRLGRGTRAGKPETARQFGRRQPAGQLQQAERVAARLGDDPVPTCGSSRPGPPRPAAPGVRVAEPLDHELWQAAQRPSVAGSRTAKIKATGSASNRRATKASACRETDRATARRRSGRPAAVPRPRRRAGSGLPGRPGSVPAAALPQPERNLQRVPLRSRQLLQPVEHRSAQLVQPGERRAPFPTRHPRPGQGGSPTPGRPHSPATPSCRIPAHRARPAPRCGPPVPRSSSRSASTAAPTLRPRPGITAGHSQWMAEIAIW